MTWSIGTIYIYYLAKFLTPSLTNEILTFKAEVQTEARYVEEVLIYYHAKFRPPSLKNEILTSEAEVEVEAEAEVQTEARYR